MSLILWMNRKKRIPIIFLFLLLRKIYLATISMPNCNGGGGEKDSCPSLFFEQQTLFIALSFCLSLYQPIKAEESGRFEKVCRDKGNLNCKDNRISVCTSQTRESGNGEVKSIWVHSSVRKKKEKQWEVRKDLWGKNNIEGPSNENETKRKVTIWAEIFFLYTLQHNTIQYFWYHFM